MKWSYRVVQPSKSLPRFIIRKALKASIKKARKLKEVLIKKLKGKK